ncbi:hypothetical protein MHYP_G00110350 [Metynnis hypsauchen]
MTLSKTERAQKPQAVLATCGGGGKKKLLTLQRDKRKDCGLFRLGNRRAYICEIGSGLVRHLAVYSAFEFHIWVNIGLGCKGNSSWGSGAVMHEEPRHPPAEKEDEVWHLIIRDEKLGL